MCPGKSGMDREVLMAHESIADFQTLLARQLHSLCKNGDRVVIRSLHVQYQQTKHTVVITPIQSQIVLTPKPTRIRTISQNTPSQPSSSIFSTRVFTSRIPPDQTTQLSSTTHNHNHNHNPPSTCISPQPIHQPQKCRSSPANAT